jgi:hypothetical protein
MSSEDWSWRVGVLNGVGECCWQQKDGMIRRITKLIWQSQPVPSMLFLKHLVGGALICAQEVSKGSSVVFECIPDPDLIRGVEECWRENRGTILRPNMPMPTPKLLR